MRKKVENIESIMSEVVYDKKKLIPLLILYIVVSLIVLVIIWWPKPKDYISYEPVDISAKKTQLAGFYMNEISTIFKQAKKNELSRLISYDYREYVGKSTSEIIASLEEDGFLQNDITIRDMTVYVDDETYVYTTTIYAGQKSKKVNVIEKTPYNYSIVFDDFYSFENTSKTTKKQDIKFTIESIYKNLNYIEIDMKIENLNKSYAKFDFSSATAVQAILEDGTKYPLANAISSEANTNIESNTTVNKSFVFNIPAQLQEGIKYIVFNGVTIEFATTNISVEI